LGRSLSDLTEANFVTANLVDQLRSVLETRDLDPVLKSFMESILDDLKLSERKAFSLLDVLGLLGARLREVSDEKEKTLISETCPDLIHLVLHPVTH
jgi:hypothetical protein